MTAVVVFHKNPLSARLRLLRFADGGLIGPDRPEGRASEESPDGAVPAPHPGDTCTRLAALWGVAAGALACRAPALMWLGDAPVFAIECADREPSAELAAAAGGAWIEFPQVRRLGPDDQTAARLLYGRTVG